MKKAVETANKQNHNTAAANNVSQHKNRSREDSGFVDNRPETKALKSLQIMINDSPRMAAQRQRTSNTTGGTAQVIKGPDTNVPNGPAESSKFIRLYAPSLISKNIRDQKMNSLSGPIQRKIGFEFEVGMPFGKPKGEKQKDIFSEKSYYNLEDPMLKPNDKIHQGVGFHVVEDHGGVKRLNVESILEYVIDEAEENQDFNKFIVNLKNAKKHISKYKMGKQSKFPTDDGKYLIGGTIDDSMSGGGQSTFGVRLQGIPGLFKEKIESDKFGGEDKALFTTRILELAKTTAQKAMELESLKDLPEDKAKVEGYLYLAAQYLACNALSDPNAKILDKNRVPFLVRSQLSEIREAALGKKAKKVLIDNKDAICKEMIKSSKAKETEAIVPGKKPKVGVWLKGVLAGTDEKIDWGQSKTIKPEEVGKKKSREMGAVVEQRHLKFGPINVTNWENEAKKVYEKIRKLNGIDE